MFVKVKKTARVLSVHLGGRHEIMEAKTLFQELKFFCSSYKKTFGVLILPKTLHQDEWSMERS